MPNARANSTRTGRNGSQSRPICSGRHKKRFGRTLRRLPPAFCNWLKSQLKPWRVKSWCIGKPSARYVAKMEDVLDVYQRPYDPLRPVVCLDECSKELRSTPRGSILPESGGRELEDYEYERNGTRNLFLWVEPLVSRRRIQVTQRRTSVDFAEVLRRLVDFDYPQAKRIVLVTDNLNTHTPAALYERFEPEEARRIANKIEWHYTPEHGSWLNIAEIELSVLSRQCLSRRVADAGTLEYNAAVWERERNSAQVTINWQFTTDDARIKLKRLYPEIRQESVT